MREGVAGMSRCLTPSGVSAFITAFMMVAGAAIREEGAMICATPVGSALRQSADSANLARSSPAKLV